MTSHLMTSNDINTRTVITVKDFLEFKRNSGEGSTRIEKMMLSQNRAAQKLWRMRSDATLLLLRAVGEEGAGKVCLPPGVSWLELILSGSGRKGGDE